MNNLFSSNFIASSQPLLLLQQKNAKRLYAGYDFIALKEVPLFAILTRNISPSSCQYVSTIPEKKTACYRLFVRVCTEKMMDYQYRVNGTRNIYSNYNQMRAYVECSPNQSKKNYTLLHDFSIKPSTKFWRFRKNAGRFCIWFYESVAVWTALPAHAIKMVITIVCV